MDANTLPKPFYSDDRCTIYHGDCRDLLPLLGRFDLLLTDPPYGLKRFSNGQPTRVARKNGVDGVIDWDVKPTADALEMMLSSSRYQVIWGMNNFSLPQTEYFLVWDKEQTVDNFASAELAYTNVKCPAKVFRFSIRKHIQTGKVHPTQKPVPLMQWYIGIAGDEVKTILDPYMGSGTSLVAAKLEGRHAVGIEINERYCELAAERLRQGVLF